MFTDDSDEDEYEVPDEDDSSSNLDEPDDLAGQREDIEEDVIHDVPVPVILKDQFNFLIFFKSYFN